jgi:hypothetical protein
MAILLAIASFMPRKLLTIINDIIVLGLSINMLKTLINQYHKNGI